MSSHLAAPTPPTQAVISQRRAAVIAGLAYAAIIVLALFANFLVLDRLTDPNDAAATSRDIAGSEMLFRIGIVAFVIVLVADVVVAWALYVFLQRTSRELSLFAAWFRLVYVAIAAAALLNLLLAVKLVDDTGYTTGLGPGQRDIQAMSALDAYLYGWRIGLVFFGVHLLLLGYVMVKSDYVPRILGRLVALAGFGYVLMMLAGVLWPDSKDLFLLLLAVVAIPGEFGLTVWLIWRGGKEQSTTGRPAERVNAAGSG
jgi:Domain of unknown function (DUF4386)